MAYGTYRNTETKDIAYQSKGQGLTQGLTSVNFGFVFNVTNLIIQITGIFKSVMNPGIAQIVAAQFFLSTPYQATKTFWLVVQTLIAISHSGKIQKMIIIVHYH